jgi:restriction system protein
MWIIGIITGLFFIWIVYRWLGQPAWLDRLPALLNESMSLAETASAFTLAVIWSGLWWRHQQGNTAGPLPLSREHLFRLSPSAFERYVAGLFRQKGYRVRVRGQSGDLGVDLEIRDEWGRKAIVQCKRHQNTVGAEVIRELYGTLIHEGANRAFLVTTADISDAARNWARSKPLTLIDGQTLVEIATAIREQNTLS